MTYYKTIIHTVVTQKSSRPMIDKGFLVIDVFD